VVQLLQLLHLLSNDIGGAGIIVVTTLAVVDRKLISWEDDNVAAATPGEEDLSHMPNTP